MQHSDVTSRYTAPIIMQTNPMTQTSRTAGTLQAMLLIVANVLPTMGIVSLIPVLPQLFGHFHAAPHAQFLVPAIITAPSICIALLSPVAGTIADRIGRRRMLLAALLVYAVFGCAPLLLNDLGQIIASRVCLGITEAIIYTNVNTLMGDYFQGAVRRKWLAWQNAIGSLLATGLIIVGGVLGTISWRGPFAMYALAVPIFLAVLAFTWEPEPHTDEQETGGEIPLDAPFPVAAMTLVYAVTLFGAIIFFIEVLQLGLVMNSIGAGRPDTIGLVSAGTGFALPLGAYVLGRAKQLRVGYLFALALAFFAVSFWILGHAANVLTVIAGASLAQFACGITYPLLSTWCQSKLHFRVRARGVGIWTSVFFIGQFASTTLVSLATGPAGGIGGVMIVFALVCAAAVPISLFGEALLGRKAVPT
ncbi:MAG: MFS transporter [Proteobacteria bacterium]|nr:MFS transporter [Pseudomonadota bacterium]